MTSWVEAQGTRPRARWGGGRRFALVATLAVLWVAAPLPALAQDDTPGATIAEPGAPKQAPKKHPRKPPKPAPKLQAVAPKRPAARPLAAQAPPAPAPPPAARPAFPPPARPASNFTAQLQQAGTRTCLPQIEQFAAASMQGVTTWNTASNWMTGGADSHAVSLFVGQQYGGNPNVPFGVTGVFAAPAGAGKCDAMSVQVVPSPLPCAKLRDSLLAHGKQIGDLAGVPLLQDAGGQFMLVPTGAGTCVLVGVKTAYGR